MITINEIIYTLVEVKNNTEAKKVVLILESESVKKICLLRYDNWGLIYDKLDSIASSGTLYDYDKELIDTLLKKDITFLEYRSNILQEVQSICKSRIEAGFTVGTYYYPSLLTDQINLQLAVLTPTHEAMCRDINGVWSMRQHSLEEISIVLTALSSHILENRVWKDSLIIQLNNCTTIDEVTIIYATI
jgi:hypothetical protein